MSTVTTQNLRSTTPKTQIVTYTSCSSKPRPKSVMLLLHKSKPKPIDWLRRWWIRDVGGGYGFASVREIFFLGGLGTCKARSGRRWEKRRKGRKLTGLASECGWTSDLRWSMGWSYVSMSSVRRGGAEVSLRMSFGVCEEWPIQNSIEGKMEREIHLRHGNCKAYFTVKLISTFSLTIFSSGTKQTLECKTFLDFSLHAKQTQL